MRRIIAAILLTLACASIAEARVHRPFFVRRAIVARHYPQYGRMGRLGGGPVFLPSLRFAPQ